MKKTSMLPYILRAKNRLKILKELDEGQKISAQLEKQTGMYKGHISRTLGQLKKKGLIQCVNPKDRNFKFYELTSEGKKVLQKANKILSEIKR